MRSVFRRSPAHGWILAACAAVLGAIGLAIVVDIARIDARELLHPALLTLAGLPLLAATGLGLLAAKSFRRRAVVITVDATGVALRSGPVLPWSEIGAIVVTTSCVGYGFPEYITFRRRFDASDIAAKRAERVVHALFTDQSFAPAAIDRTADDMFDEFDAALEAAGFARAKRPEKRFRLVLWPGGGRSARPTAKSRVSQVQSIIW